jgi:hypothetical protein
VGDREWGEVRSWEGVGRRYYSREGGLEGQEIRKRRAMRHDRTGGQYLSQCR